MAEFTEVMKQRKRMCESMDRCYSNHCPLSSGFNGRNIPCSIFMRTYPQEAEKIIMAWAKEHPIKTNADKFREVFGTGISNDFECPFDDSKCEEANFKCNNCEYVNFWSQEYVEPKKGETE